MRKILVIVVLTFLIVSGCIRVSVEKDPKKETLPIAAPIVIDEKTNIHYTGQFCGECHEQTPVKGGDLFLKFNGDYNQLCRCHHGMSPGYCHPLVTYSETDKKTKIPPEFPLTSGKFTCNTCHDIYKQCQKRLFDRWSLRGAPYPHKADVCYQCHNPDSYKKLNTHDQIDDDGKIIIKNCLYCHEKKPDEQTATYEEVTFVGDIRALCRRCHPIEGNHAGNYDHMANPISVEGLARMEALKEKYDIILPLTKDGKMTCITCHNPHEKGVIPSDKPSAKGADSKNRHRVAERFCKECHQM